MLRVGVTSLLQADVNHDVSVATTLCMCPRVDLIVIKIGKRNVKLWIGRLVFHIPNLERGSATV